MDGNKDNVITYIRCPPIPCRSSLTGFCGNVQKIAFHLLQLHSFLAKNPHVQIISTQKKVANFCSQPIFSAQNITLES
jgi:hypothetical protein